MIILMAGGDNRNSQVAMGRADAEKQFQEAIEAGREEGEKMCTDMISLACQVSICSSLLVSGGESGGKDGSRKNIIGMHLLFGNRGE